MENKDINLNDLLKQELASARKSAKLGNSNSVDYHLRMAFNYADELHKDISNRVIKIKALEKQNKLSWQIHECDKDINRAKAYASKLNIFFMEDYIMAARENAQKHNLDIDKQIEEVYSILTPEYINEKIKSYERQIKRMNDHPHKYLRSMTDQDMKDEYLYRMKGERRKLIRQGKEYLEILEKLSD